MTTFFSLGPVFPYVVSKLFLMTSSMYGTPKIWASVSSLVHICATDKKPKKLP